MWTVSYRPPPSPLSSTAVEVARDGVLRVASRLHHTFLSRALTGANRLSGVIEVVTGIEPATCAQSENLVAPSHQSNTTRC